MPTFICRTIPPDGRSVSKRELRAASAAGLRRQLEGEGHFVLELLRADGAAGAASWFRRTSGRESAELVDFNREFAVLLKAGLPVVGALDALLEHSGGGRGTLRRFLEKVRADVAGGMPLSEAAAQHPVSRLYVATLRAGERSGDLVSALERFLVYRKKIAEVRQQVVAASVYPLILTVVSVFTLAFLMLYVVPAFAGPFRDAGTELPGLTRALLAFSETLRSRYPAMLAVLAGLFGAGFYLFKAEAGRRALDRWKLLLPVLGPLYFHYATATVTRTLGTVLAGGTPLVEALRVAGGVVDNRHLADRFQAVGKSMEQGEGFADSLRGVEALPGLAIRMIDAGEGTGAMGSVLEDVADYYDADVNTRLRMLTAAVEPALMILMGGLIGLIVLAMYLPIFQLAGTIS
jgi:type IV pilus assembly protein PilC